MKVRTESVANGRRMVGLSQAANLLSGRGLGCRCWRRKVCGDETVRVTCKMCDASLKFKIITKLHVLLFNRLLGHFMSISTSS